MYKSIAILFTILSFSSYANLWCALSNGDTPSQAMDKNNIPYQTIQVDLLDDKTIQVDITDIYGDGQNSKVILASETKTLNKTINGVKTGKYSSMESNETVDINYDAATKKISLTINNGLTYACEIPN